MSASHRVPPSPALIPAAVYARVSTEDQRELYSLDRQVKACLEYAALYGFHVDLRHIFQDDITGKTVDRPALSQLRELVPTGVLNAVLIYKWNRFSRELGYQILIDQEFLRHGVQTFDITTPPGEESPDRTFMKHVMGAMSELEHAYILERTEGGRRDRASAGHPSANNPPLGYRYEGDARTGTYVVMLDEAAVVERIYRLYVEDHQTMYQIARQLQYEGVPTYASRRVRGTPDERSCAWHTSYIYRILTNTAYVGTVYYGKTHRTASPQRPAARTLARPTSEANWIAITIPPIIERELWDAAQQRRRTNAQHNRRNTRHAYLLGGGRIQCGVCGHTMHGTMTHGTRYYRCNPYRLVSETPCRRNLRAERIEAAAWTQVEQLVEDPDYLQTLMAADAESASSAARQAERATLEAELADIGRRLGRWEAAYEADSITLATFKAKTQGLEAKRAVAQTRLHLLTLASQRDAQWASEWERLAAWLRGLRGTLPGLDLEGRQDVLTTLALQVIYQADKTYRFRIEPGGGSTPFQATQCMESNRTPLRWDVAG